jgi:hypothetical protein
MARALWQRFVALFARRGAVEPERKAHADGAAVIEQMRRLDADIAVLCRDLADAERVLRMTT